MDEKEVMENMLKGVEMTPEFSRLNLESELSVLMDIRRNQKEQTELLKRILEELKSPSNNLKRIRQGIHSLPGFGHHLCKDFLAVIFSFLQQPHRCRQRYNRLAWRVRVNVLTRMAEPPVNLNGWATRLILQEYA